MGLLSVADALLDKPMDEVLLQLPVSQDVKAALCGGQNRFRDVYEVLLAMEPWPSGKNSANAPPASAKLKKNFPDTYKLAIQRAPPSPSDPPALLLFRLRLSFRLFLSPFVLSPRSAL